MTNINYPKHKHPHGVNDTVPNPQRIWVCEECSIIFSDNQLRDMMNESDWGHPCKRFVKSSGVRCESHLEPYLPDISVPPEQPQPTLCEHIEKLVELGYVQKNDSKWDKEKKDFVDVPAEYYTPHWNIKNHMLQLKYCPTCGAKIGEK